VPVPAASQAPADPTESFNGVFMGGGAKGLAYAGALKAVREHLRFGSVAGSSAGAITATLVAADLPVEEFEDKAAEGIAMVSRQLLRGSLPFVGKNLFRIDRLEGWLDEVLHGQLERAGVAHESTEPVTFDQLFRATRIELNVVAMDLHRRQPIVFNHQTTGNCEVARAVMASSAIPVAMPVGRVAIREPDGEERVHRLVDGGAWANYPAFVYNDPSFRSFHGLGPVPERGRTLGFVLDPSPSKGQDSAKPLRMLTRRRDDGDLGAGIRSGPLGMLLNWPFLRGMLAMVFPVAVVALLFDWFRTQTGGYFPSLGVLPDGLEPAALALIIVAGGLFAILAVFLAVVLYRFAKEAFDVGLPALFATMSVGPRIPDWVGHADEDHVIRLSVVPGLSTVSFRIGAKKREQVVRQAYEEASEQLAEQLGGLAGPTEMANDKPAPPAEEPVDSNRVPGIDEEKSAPRFPYAIALLIVLPLVGFFIPEIAKAFSLSDWGGALVLTLGLAGIVAFLLYRGARLHRRVIEIDYLPSVPSVVIGLLLWGTLTGLLGNTLVQERGALSRLSAGETQSARVVSVCCDGASNRLVDLEISRPIPNIYFAGEGSVVDYCDPPRRTVTCLTADTSQTDFEVGQKVDLWVVTGTGEVFLEGDQWGASIKGRFGLLGLWVVFAVYFFWSVTNAYRLWRHRPTRAG
jgi:hypothetical protein